MRTYSKHAVRQDMRQTDTSRERGIKEIETQIEAEKHNQI